MGLQYGTDVGLCECYMRVQTESGPIMFTIMSSHMTPIYVAYEIATGVAHRVVQKRHFAVCTNLGGLYV